VAPVGLDLLQQIEHGVVAIGAAGDEQTLVAADQGDLAQVVGATSCYYCPVARYALLGTGCGSEAQIEVSLPCGELTQRAYRNAIIHGLAHCTWQTATGMSWR